MLQINYYYFFGTNGNVTKLIIKLLFFGTNGNPLQKGGPKQQEAWGKNHSATK